MEIKDIKNCKNIDIESMKNFCIEKIKILCNLPNLDVEAQAKYLQIKDAGNLACAILYKQGEGKKENISHSGFNKYDRLKYLADISSNYIAVPLHRLYDHNHRYTTLVLDRICSENSSQWNREVDSEYKIIEQIAKENIKPFIGELVIWTSRYPCQAAEEGW